MLTGCYKDNCSTYEYIFELYNNNVCIVCIHHMFSMLFILFYFKLNTLTTRLTEPWKVMSDWSKNDERDRKFYQEYKLVRLPPFSDFWEISGILHNILCCSVFLKMWKKIAHDREHWRTFPAKLYSILEYTVKLSINPFNSICLCYSFSYFFAE